MYFYSSLGLIGNTPLVELSRIKIPNNNRIFAKLESYNPAGGVKDRVALHILSQAQKEGKIYKDSVVVEATAGNTGLGIAFVCLHLGLRAILVVPDKFSIEKQILMQALGAEVINTPKEQGMQGAIKKAQELLDSIPHAFSLNQFENLSNPQTHYLTTAQEIYADMQGVRDLDRESIVGGNIESCQVKNQKYSNTNLFNQANALSARSCLSGNSKAQKANASKDKQKNSQINLADKVCNDFKSYQVKSEESLLNKNSLVVSVDSPKSVQKSLPNLDYFVCGAGSGGSFSGIMRYLKEQDSRIVGVLCDPVGSIIGGGVQGCANIEGIGNTFIPKTMDTTLIERVQKISDEEAYQGVRLLAQYEGLLMGISSGACLMACLNLAKVVENQLIVTLFADSLSRYFSRNLIN